MGWTYQRKPYGMTTLEAVKAQFTWSHVAEENRPHIVEGSMRGSVAYLAIRFPAALVKDEGSYIPDADGSITWCAVILTKSDKRASDGYDFGYKDMEETMGPCEADCPAKILNILSALRDPNSYAHDWRKRCRESLAKPKRKAFTDGQIIVLKEPASFGDGVKRQTFRVQIWQNYTRRGKAKTFYLCQDTGARCRISGSVLDGATIQQPIAA